MIWETPVMLGDVIQMHEESWKTWDKLSLQQRFCFLSPSSPSSAHRFLCSVSLHGKAAVAAVFGL